MTTAGYEDGNYGIWQIIISWPQQLAKGYSGQYT